MNFAVRLGIGLFIVVIIVQALNYCSRQSDLNRYCSGKDPSGGYIYEDCMGGGWKDWYADASWMR